MTATSPERRTRAMRWRRALNAAVRRRRSFGGALEVAAALLLILVANGTYALLTGSRGEGPLTPVLVASLLVANLVPAILLLILLGRRMARKRSLRSPIGGSGQLHVRLVAIFSILATVPMLLVVFMASFLFQYGGEFWFSSRARGMIDNAREVGRMFYENERTDVTIETRAMVYDIQQYLTFSSINSPEFSEAYAFWQVQGRKMYESAIVRILPNGSAQTLVIVNPDARPVEQRLTPAVIRQLGTGDEVVVRQTASRLEAITRLLPDEPVYLYNARQYNPVLVERSENIAQDYETLLERSRRLQLRFNATLYLLTLMIVGAAVLVALKVADRLVRPVGDLVGAARRVAEGDLSARVESRRARDEVGTLAAAFNRMTRQLESQRGDLVSANTQLESRRVFTEAVLSGVSAGVVSIDRDGKILLMNRSAAALLDVDREASAGRPIGNIAPDLAAWLTAGERDGVVQLVGAGEPRTVAVRRVQEADGTVLTFDDITEQLADQRRAAWSDVARRIAHEIKNPLTPIQLAAERLQRRYGREIQTDPGTFRKLTETIVRQVGDLRRMVDEFSSFARMPKPVFRSEPIVELVRQNVFLHQVAHPAVAFDVRVPEPSPNLVCDRRQIAQALTNLVKNGVEAIEARQERSGEGGHLLVVVTEPAAGALEIMIEDDGIGLPADRDRLVEPYVTTRARGTGLGLAIVKKIAEEHLGSLAFNDRPGGGTRVCLLFDTAQLSRLDAGQDGVFGKEERVTDHAD